MHTETPVSPSTLQPARQWFSAGLWLVACQAMLAANPIITHIRAADPSAEIWGDGKVWIYASHDQDDATDYSSMDGYHAFSSSDMVNWTDHGEILHSRDVRWGIAAGGYMCAPDAACKDGTYYLYFPHKDASGQWRIGVATSPRPEGPFTDVGNYIPGTDFIDPTCFIDDDGQAYLYWGYHKVARLKTNMIELAEAPRTVDYGTTGFQEGVYMHKRNGIYYFSWSRWQSPNNGGHYSTGPSPYGPFTYRGMLAGGPPGAQDHHSIIEYCGQAYYFYHVGNYQGGSSFRRSTCVEHLQYNADGTIQMVNHTSSGVGVNVCTPWRVPGVIQAEGYTAMSGLQQASTSDVGGGLHVGSIENGDWVEYAIQVAQAGFHSFELRAAAGGSGGTVQVLLDGSPVGIVAVPPTGGWQGWTNVASNLEFSTDGLRTLRLEFAGGEGSLLDLNYIRVRDLETPAAPAGLVVISGGGPVVLEWEDHPAPDLVGYKVYRSSSSGAGYVPIATNLPASSHVDEAYTIGLTYHYVVTAVDSSGNESPHSNEVSARPDISLIEAESFAGQSGVRTEPCVEGGLNLSYIDGGDWAEYASVTIPAAGEYRVDCRIAAHNTSGTITLKSGAESLATVRAQNTGGWQVWKTVGTNCTFNTAGLRTLRLEFGNGGGFNLNWFALTPVSPSGSNQPPAILTQPQSQTVAAGSPATFTVTASGTASLGYQWFFNATNPVGQGTDTLSLGSVQPSHAGAYFVVVSNAANVVTSAVASLTVLTSPSPAAEIHVEAEDFAEMSGIQTQATSDVGGGQNVGFINAGDWAEYLVNLPVAGEYQASFRVAAAGPGESIQVISGGITNGSLAVPATGGWQAWTNTLGTLSFPSNGMQTVRLNFLGGAGYLFNINWFKLFAPGSASAATNLLWRLTSHGELVLEWPDGQGWRLELQTNSLMQGLGINWVDVDDAHSPFTNAVDATAPACFYRLVHP